jgi:hypothetical protein
MHACKRYTPVRDTPMSHTAVRCTPMRYTAVRCMPMRSTPVRKAGERDGPIRCTPSETHAPQETACVRARFIGCTSLKYIPCRMHAHKSAGGHLIGVILGSDFSFGFLGKVPLCVPHRRNIKAWCQSVKIHYPYANPQPHPI